MGAAASPPLCGCGPLVGLILLILLIFRWFWVAGGGRPLCGCGPLVELILLILLIVRPRGADFAHFANFSLVLGGWWGLLPRPLCGCGPLVGQIWLILLVFHLNFGHF